jgi:hypothetical protein
VETAGVILNKDALVLCGALWLSVGLWGFIVLRALYKTYNRSNWGRGG